MPTLSSLLRNLSERMRANGAQVAHRPLDTVASAASFLEAAGVPIEDEAAAAAIAIALLGTEDARGIAGALNLRGDLFPESSVTTTGSDFTFLGMLEKGDRAQGTVGAAVLFSQYCTAAVQGDTARLEALRGIVDFLMRKDGPHPALGRVLDAEMRKVTSTPSATPEADNYLFSISIDLAGSTDAKTRVMKVANGNTKRIDDLNLDVYREFCRIEKSFYEACVNNYAPTAPIPPDSFFTVKGIGDEIWILCNVTADNVFPVGHRLIDAAIHVAEKAVRFLAMQNDERPNFSRDFNPGAIEPISSPVKIYLDLIKHASNLGAHREEFLAQEIPKLLRQFHTREPTRSEIVNVTRRLGLAAFEPIGAATARAYRTDYIGHEIDRFFRATKTALPGIVTIGETMAKEMQLEFLPKEGDVFSVHTDEHIALRAGTPDDPIYCCVSTPEEWKGIGYVYTTYGLFAPRTLKGLLGQMDADRKNGMAALPYDDSAKRISRAVLDQLVREIIESDRCQ